jgi:death on curing protein
LAAAYGYGIAKSHTFIDGNKRTAFMVMFTFLQANGWRFVVPEPEVVVTMQRVAAGEISETLLADWLRENSTRC